jgi:hypothetical protein
VGELLNRISSRELAEWSAYERLTGLIGQRRDDILTAQLIMTIASLVKKENSPPLDIADFIPKWTEG